MAGIRRLEELSWPQLDALDRARTIVLVPVSPLEEHGPHLPIGVDGYTAQAFTEALARQILLQRPATNLLLVPWLPMGSWVVNYRATFPVR